MCLLLMRINLLVDFKADISEAIDLGFESVMIDGSRLPLAENIEKTRIISELAHKCRSSG